MFAPYGPPYTLPIPAGAQPSALTTAPDVNYVNYPASSDRDLIALAGVSENFSLRFSGERSGDVSPLLPSCSGIAAVECAGQYGPVIWVNRSGWRLHWLAHVTPQVGARKRPLHAQNARCEYNDA